VHSNRPAKKNSPYFAVITVVVSLFGGWHPPAAPAATDPNLSITISRTNQNVVLRWFGSNAVPYQVESTSNLTTWANSSLVITGAGGVLSVTNPIAGQARAFYRVRKLPTPVGPSAVFNPGTGILTIIGDDSDNVIVVGRNAAGTILVNNGAIPISGGTATVTNTVLIEVFGRDGNDELTIDQAGGAMPAAHLFGEAGKDTLTGASAVDELAGGPGSDTLIGRGGNDQLFGDADDDTFVWNPGDGSDVIEGGIGQDTLAFNGSAISEIFDASANGARLRFTRNVGAIVMDVDGVERVICNVLGGADVAVINNLAGTAVTEVTVDLGPGDAVGDVITLNGTAAPNTFSIAANAGAVEAAGLGALVRVVNGEQTNDVVSIVGVGGDIVNINGSALGDTMTVTASGSNAVATATGFNIPVSVRGALTLTMNGLGGQDMISCTGNLAAIVPIVLDGGNDNDTLLGSNGADLLFGGAGDDFIDGQQGNDTAFLGADNDTYQWDPGDGSDTVEGQGGTDVLLFNGSAISEIFDASANGARLRFTRNVGNIVMDVDGVEILDLNALGGVDTVTVNDLSGTDLASVNADLASTLGGTTGDAAADTLVINGSNGDDIITANNAVGQVVVSGLAASVRVEHFETTLDFIRIQGLGGHDVIDASGLDSTGPRLTLDGGLGDDILLGGAGDDNLLGGDNDDVLIGGPGTDTLDGGLGENTVFQDGPSTTTGIVSIFGDGAANVITISRDIAGNLLSNSVPIPGATIANTALIRVFGRGGDDAITLNQANGALPASMLFGGAGLDTLTAGAGNDLLFGGIDNDTLLGQGGFDWLFGGAGDDRLTGGDADDLAFGEAGNDRFVWNPGDDTDLNEGGSGLDTVEVNGGNGAEQFTTTANGARVRFDRVNPAPFSIDIGTCEALVLLANGGDDTFSATGNLATLIQITVDGGPGLDTILGSNGPDVLIGGDNDDFIDGQQGNDTVFMGDGNDTFQWDPGDGSDTVEGQAGTDTLLFNGSAVGEIFDASANGARLRFTRNVGSIVMDVDGVERVTCNALGGVDTAVINSLAGTAVTEVNVNLAGTLGGATGDAAADVITINGTAAADTFNMTASAGVVSVSGIIPLLRISNSEVANDDLIVNGLGGVDIFNIGAGVGALIGVTTNQ
jgi:Ca2+-binding RTX toxin-like protein